MPTREVPLAEAATLLGLTPEAVRLRLRRGKTLRGTRRADGWYVALPSDLDATVRDRPAATNGDHAQPYTSTDDWSRPNAATDHDQSQPIATDQASAAEIA